MEGVLSTVEVTLKMFRRITNPAERGGVEYTAEVTLKNVPQDYKSSGAEYNTSMADNSFLDFFILGERHSYAITKPYKVENSTSDKRLVTPSNEDVYGGKEVKL
jgi:hypothetical protein